MYACKNVGVATRKVTRYFGNQVADGLGVERVGMKDHADAMRHRHPERGHEAKRMEERQNAQYFVTAIEHEDLRHLANVGEQIVMREHYAFGFAGAAAGEDDGSQAVRGAGAVHPRRVSRCGAAESRHIKREMSFSEVSVQQARLPEEASSQESPS